MIIAFTLICRLSMTLFKWRTGLIIFHTAWLPSSLTAMLPMHVAKELLEQTAHWIYIRKRYTVTHFYHNILYRNNSCTIKGLGDRGSTVVKVLCYKSEGSWFDPSWCQWIFHWHKIRSQYGPRFDSASNGNEYQEYFLGVKAAGP